MNFRRTSRLSMTISVVSIFFVALVCYAAYNHQGDTDSQNFRNVYPQAVGTKLDSCATCHTGGSYVSGEKTTTLGSCQWCHYTYGYDQHGKIEDTLNPYGLAYLSHGRSPAAITAIQDLDSDADGYSNKVEIAALRYPGDPKDDPTKIPAPFKVFMRSQLEAMPLHTQFLLMNASKSTDDYAEYTGVTIERLLKRLVLPSATGVKVASPDGFSQDHPFDYDPTLNVYHVKGTYPAATFYYEPQADVAQYPNPGPNYGWANYSAPSEAGRVNGDPIVNKDGLKMILAIKRDGQYLTPGVLNTGNKLDGEGPFRVVPPQKVPGPPDQRSTAAQKAPDGTDWVWPYNKDGDHNAGSSSRSVTTIRVDPLPEGTTDINLLEAGWPYIDEEKIVVYGAINPLENIKDQLTKLIADVGALPKKEFQIPREKLELKWKLEMARWFVAVDRYGWASWELEHVIQKMDGCAKSGHPDRCDWLRNCDTQATLYWAVNEVMVLLKILD
jgi:hypothetical protein